MTIETVNTTRLQEENVSTTLFIMPTLLLRVHSFVPSVTVTCLFLEMSSSDSTVEFLCAEFNTHSSLTQHETRFSLLHPYSINMFYQYSKILKKLSSATTKKKSPDKYCHERVARMHRINYHDSN